MADPDDTSTHVHKWVLNLCIKCGARRGGTATEYDKLMAENAAIKIELARTGHWQRDVVALKAKMDGVQEEVARVTKENGELRATITANKVQIVNQAGTIVEQQAIITRQQSEITNQKAMHRALVEERKEVRAARGTPGAKDRKISELTNEVAKWRDAYNDLVHKEKPP